MLDLVPGTAWHLVQSLQWLHTKHLQRYMFVHINAGDIKCWLFSIQAEYYEAI